MRPSATALSSIESPRSLARCAICCFQLTFNIIPMQILPLFRFCLSGSVQNTHWPLLPTSMMFHPLAVSPRESLRRFSSRLPARLISSLFLPPEFPFSTSTSLTQGVPDVVDISPHGFIYDRVIRPRSGAAAKPHHECMRSLTLVFQ